MKIEARVITASGVIGFAVFDSLTIGEKIALILDREPDPRSGLGMILYHPKQEALIRETGKVPEYHYVAEPIDVRPYLDLPNERRGFAMLD
jgi:hypothetical protein